MCFAHYGHPSGAGVAEGASLVSLVQGVMPAKSISHAAYETALAEVSRKASNFMDVKYEFRRVQWRAGSNRKTTIGEKPECGVSGIPSLAVMLAGCWQTGGRALQVRPPAFQVLLQLSCGRLLTQSVASAQFLLSLTSKVWLCRSCP